MATSCARRDDIDFVIFEITKGCCIALAAAEEVLVDAEEYGAVRRMPFGKLAREMAFKIPLDSCRADALAPSQTAAIDAVEVLCVDELLKRLSGSLPSQDANEALAEITSAVAAVPLVSFHNQAATPHGHVAVAHLS